MTDLRQAAKKFLQAWYKWRFAGGKCREEVVAAVELLDRGLADEEPTTDELLSRLQPGQRLRVNVLSAQSPRPICIATVGYEPFSAPVRGKDGYPVSEIASHPAAALRAALLQLPEPTQPPPREEA